jgi:hypothetical protein
MLELEGLVTHFVACAWSVQSSDGLASLSQRQNAPQNIQGSTIPCANWNGIHVEKYASESLGPLTSDNVVRLYYTSWCNR